MKAGDIVAINLEPTVGGEKGKTRPCLVLVGEGHPWNIIIVVPITEDHSKRTKKLFVPIDKGKSTGLEKASSVDCFQIRCLSKNRIKGKIGVVPKKTLDSVLMKIAAILDIGEEHLSF